MASTGGSLFSMSRLARSTIIGYPHQVTQSGNYGQNVFEEEADFSSYLRWLQEYSCRYSIEIWAYCLMRNHVHFVCVPLVQGALAHGFNTLHMRYAQYFHGKKRLSGHLWKGRFLSCILDDRSVLEEVRFIENNPVRGGLINRAEDYPWSSAPHHVLGSPDPVIKESGFLNGNIEDWRAFLGAPGDESILNRTWRSLKTGRPSGDIGFVQSLEGIVGRRLMALPRGRPRKNAPIILK
jgi:putative transposase